MKEKNQALKYLPIVTKEEWNQLDDTQKKITIAKDVLARIQSKNFFPKTNGFLKFENKGIVELKEIFNTTECEGCARGGIFCSYIGINNDLKLKLKSTTNIILEGCVSSNMRSEYHFKKDQEIRDLFERKQITLIEATFEGIDVINENEYLIGTYYNNEFINDETDWDRDELTDLIENFRNDLTSKEILIKIMNNIINNNGVFKL